MRSILHAIISLEKGGAEAMLRRLVEFDLVNGKSVKHYILSMTDVGFHGKVLKELGVDVFALNVHGPFDLIVKWSKIIKLIKDLDPDIIQTWMIHADFFVGTAAYVAGYRNIIWGIRTTDYSVESKITRLLRWFCARLSGIIPKRIVCAADASLEASVDAGYSREKMTVIPNGFNVEVLRSFAGHGVAIRHSLGIQDTETVVGCIGRFNPAKDHGNFVLACGHLAVRYPACRFVMVGRGLTARNSELMELINVTGFADRFILLGERSDPAACLDAMDIFVLSSCTEGFPNVLGEAMVMGVPCVSTDVGDAALLLGNAGHVVPPRDSLALAHAVSHLVDMPKTERKAQGAKGLLRVESEFSMASAAYRFNNIYQALLLSKP
jgi:glycosyltransferase involved in cell wall biosynthesis